tara:strand:- start:176 stop:583 length:408 start_codon:yes stop_codon:yes gene_type:complete
MEDIEPDNLDWAIAELHIQGMSNPKIGKILGKSRQTILRRLKKPQAQAAVNTLRNIYHNTLMAKLHNLGHKGIMHYNVLLDNGKITGSELNGLFRVLTKVFLKDFIPYDSEDPKFISALQHTKNFNQSITDRLKD